MINVGVSLVAFKEIDEIKNFLEKIQSDSGAISLFGGFELSYNLSKKLLRNLSFLKGWVMSVHAPCPETEHYPNLGSSNRAILEDSLNIIRQSAETAVEFGAKRIVLHPGYTLDVPVYTDFKKRNAMIKKFIESEKNFAFIDGKTFSSALYSKTNNYRAHLETSFRNLELALEVCKSFSVELAIENLNPRLTYLYQSPEDIVEAVGMLEGIKVCLDTGHLWISSLVYNLDFISTVEYLANTGRVATVHVHDNNSKLPGYLADEHLSPGKGIIPLSDAIGILKESGVSNFVLESVDDAEGEGFRFLRDIFSSF